ncbi:hypothetical protein [Lysobacter gummosus]
MRARASATTALPHFACPHPAPAFAGAGSSGHLLPQAGEGDSRAA